MPILIIFLIFIVYGMYNLSKKCNTNKKPFTKEELKKMKIEMLGKSEKECRKILYNYSKNKK